MYAKPAPVALSLHSASLTVLSPKTARISSVPAKRVDVAAQRGEQLLSAVLLPRELALGNPEALGELSFGQVEQLANSREVDLHALAGDPCVVLASLLWREMFGLECLPTCAYESKVLSRSGNIK